MKTELIEKLLMMLIADEKPLSSSDKEMIGEYVIVRCRDAGVHAGELVSYEGREVVLKNARRLWYWKAAEGKHTLSGVAQCGITSASKVPPIVDKIILPEAAEIISTTSKAESTIREASDYATD